MNTQTQNSYKEDACVSDTCYATHGIDQEDHLCTISSICPLRTVLLVLKQRLLLRLS